MEKSYIPVQYGIESHGNVTLPGNLALEFHVTEGEWDWSSVREISIPFPSRRILIQLPINRLS